MLGWAVAAEWQKRARAGRRAGAMEQHGKGHDNKNNAPAPIGRLDARRAPAPRATDSLRQRAEGAKPYLVSMFK